MKKLLIILLLPIIMFSFVSISQSTVLSFDLDFEFSGATAPCGSTPWLNATFDDHGSSGVVDLTLTALNLVDDEFVSGWYFNMDPEQSWSLPFTSFLLTDTNTGAVPTISFGEDSFKADGDGYFDI